jgi:DNA-directed RNA polymerase subunit RPC12/RpoP
MNWMQSWWVPLALAGPAAVLFLDPLPPANPVARAAPLPSWVTDPTPVRQPELRPDYTVAGYTYACSDCHRIIPSPSETHRVLTQHREIELQHGLNTRCFNCHHRTERDAFVDDLGEPIPWDQPQRVCSKCHGPVYRDWQRGSHGRINGYWDTARGPQSRRKCIECHDPHAPPFAPMPAAPGPNTLRMGTPEPPLHEGEHDPLRIYQHPRAGDPNH